MRAPFPLLIALLAGCGPQDVQVGIDEAHANRHTMDGSLWRFHGVFRQAGDDDRQYRFRRTTAPFQHSDRHELDIWVVAGVNEDISSDEVDAMVDWVESGGSLWLMMDHPPYVVPYEELACELGFDVIDHAVGSRLEREGTTVELTGDLLTGHPVIDGPFGRVERLEAAWGTAFPVPRDARVVAWAPDDAVSSTGYTGRLAMIASREVGAGRVLLTGETSMFTCQEGENGALRGFCDEGHEDARVAVRNAAAWLDSGG